MPVEPNPEPSKKRRVVIESPFGRNPDGSKCSPAEYARNARYLDRCIRDSLSRGEAPYASHGFFPKPGRLDDTIPEQRKQGIDAGLAWGEAAHLRACYMDHGATEGMERALAEQEGIPVEPRYIGKEPDEPEVVRPTNRELIATVRRVIGRVEELHGVNDINNSKTALSELERRLNNG